MAVQPRLHSSYDRMPPQDLDAERAVLGAMLLNPEAVGTAIEVLRDKPADVFYADPHAHIYEAMLQLYRKNVPVDILTLKNELESKQRLEDAGGFSYLTELSGCVPTSANIEYHARIVVDTAVLRKLIGACARVSGEAYEARDEVKSLLDRAESEIFQIAEQREITPIHKVGDLLEHNIKLIEKQVASGSGITGIPSGFRRLDELTSGFQPSDMVVIAARPSVGKTAMALNIASNAAIREEKNVLLFSLEMSKEQLVQRLLCMEGQIDSKKLRTGFLASKELTKLRKAADSLSWAPIFIDDTPSISVFDLKSKARRHKSTHGLDMIIVDYLQLMAGVGRSESRQVEISEISRGIKAIARELRVPVLALSQLNREAEKDDTGMPKLAHLRESGAIEQDADVVIMLSRPPAHERESMLDIIKINLAKQRNGPTGSLELFFDAPLQRFKNPEQEGAAPAPPPEYASSPESEEPYEEDDVPF